MTRLALVKNRDNSQDIVTVCTVNNTDNKCAVAPFSAFVFQYPPKPFKEDNGREVKLKYLHFNGYWGSLYLKIAAYFVRLFPKWVTY